MCWSCDDAMCEHVNGLDQLTKYGAGLVPFGLSNNAMADMASTSAGALRALAMELKNIESQPLEGFTISVNDDNLFVWTVGIYGPPNTLYQGGYFKAVIRFPPNYPYSPPSMKFITKVWHPNVYENGDLCISILHPPVDDPHSGELPCERWNPTQSVRTILLSVISLLNEPNTSSPANVDASIMYRKWKDGTDMNYADIIRKQVEQSKEEARKDGVTVPETLEEYCIKFHPHCCDDQTMDMLDLDEDMYDYGDDESDDENDYAEEDEDSGQGEN